MLELMALACPNCGQALEGGERSLVSSCPACHEIWMLQERKLQNLTILPKAVPGSDLSGCRYLPFWQWTAEITGCPDTASVYVMAFRAENIMRFGDPGRELTMEQPNLLPIEVRALPLDLIQRSAVSCFEQAVIQAWIYFSSKKPQVSIDVKPELAGLNLIFLPYKEEAERKLVLCNGKSHFLSTGILA